MKTFREFLTVAVILAILPIISGIALGLYTLKAQASATAPVAPMAEPEIWLQSFENRPTTADKDIFSLTERQTGVHQETLREIWKIETLCGQFLGTGNPLAVFPKRSQPEQRAAFLMICRRTDRDPQAQACSSAGAIGQMQFMPKTWLAYGVDADGDGVADPWSLDDAVMSAGKYLADLGYAENPWAAVAHYAGGHRRSWSSNHYANVVLRAAYKNGATELKL